MHRDRILIMGNGPSLKKDIFYRLEGIATLGMNAAYRYWDRIGIYPDVYCCLDDQVVTSHANAIAEMIKTNQCSHFFLHQNFLKIFPNVAYTQGVFFLPQLRPGKNNEELCSSLSITYTPQDIFKSSSPGKLTTGSYAIRFAGFLGYREIGLIGIDCRYTEKIPEARAVDGIMLEVAETPKQNPNYFFDEYQQEGDRYNIPNPEVHQGNLHLQAFEVLQKDIALYNLDLNISICTPYSEIFDRGIFPFLPLNEFLNGPSLSAIFIPYTTRELSRIQSQFAMWGQQDFAPYRTPPSHPDVELHMVNNGFQDIELEETIAATFDAAELQRYFDGLYFHYSKLDGLRDLYTRRFEGPVGPEGYMAGPNNQFFDIIHRFSKTMSHIAILEADVRPIRPNWLKVMVDIVRLSERFWICGSHYRGKAHIQSYYHINGNAIYNVGDPGFQEFFREVFLPYFYKRIRKDPSIAYDIIMHHFFSPVFHGKADDKSKELWSNSAHRLRFSEYIVDLSHTKDLEKHVLPTLANARHDYPDAYLIHGAIGEIEKEIQQRTGFTQKKTNAISHANALGQVIMIDPDALGYLGHYLAYDDQLNKALSPYKVAFTVLANKQLSEAIYNSRNYFNRVLTDHSWTLGIPNTKTQEVNKPALQRFTNEIREYIKSIVTYSFRSRIKLYMYCAGIPHAQAIAELIDEFPQLEAVVNLFYLPFHFQNMNFNNVWLPLLKKLSRQDRLQLLLPTQQLSDDLKKSAEFDLPITPHPSPTISDKLFSCIQQGDYFTSKKDNHQTTLLFPGLPTQGKRPQQAIQSINYIAANRCDLHIVMRDGRKKDTNAELCALFENVHPDVEKFSGQLNREEFLEKFINSDIVVLPYGPNMFKYRNSGLLVDALYLSKPVIAVKGTWLGDIVDNFKCGVAIPEPTAKHILEATDIIHKNIKKIQENIKLAAATYFSNNSWDALVRIILNMDNDRLLHRQSSNSNIYIQQSINTANIFDTKLSFILGNAPSLKNVKINKLNGFSTIGMNVAFRHWQKINWYPKYYICLDAVVTESQKDGIFGLVQNKAHNGIRLFMLRKHILKHHPRLRENQSVIIFDDYLHTPVFDGADPMTTGSHSALFAALLGYKKICLLGIDCSYVQLIPEAKKVKGHVLEMTKTPGKNPNYFFDDYQQKGDRFNVPDSKPDLHYRSWVMVKERMEKLGVDVINCNPESKLDMFDYVPLEKVLGKR